MSDQEILEKAIQKAQTNGFMTDYKFDYSKDMGWTYVLREKPEQTDRGLTANVTGMLSEGDIIYDHDFAKALWGDEEIETGTYAETYTQDWDNGYGALDGGQEYTAPAWQYHLQNMVISEDPIKYLGENL